MGRERTCRHAEPGRHPYRVSAASDIRVDTGPASLAVTPTDVWVANELSGTVCRVPRSTGKVQCIAVADGPSSLVVHDGQVWVTNQFSGSVSRIDIDTNAVHEQALGGAPVAVAVVGDEVWAAAGAYRERPASRRSSGLDRPGHQ